MPYQMSPRQPWRAGMIFYRCLVTEEEKRGWPEPAMNSRHRRTAGGQVRLEPATTWVHLPGPRLAAEILETAEKPKAPAESWGRAGEKHGRGGRRTWPAGSAGGQGLRQECLVLRHRRREGRQLQLGDAAQAAGPRHSRGGGVGAEGPGPALWALGSSTARPPAPHGPGRRAAQPWGPRAPPRPAASALPASR